MLCRTRTVTRAGSCPIPATYVIGTDGTIALAYVDVDYQNRLEPADILAALQSLSKNHKGEHHANISR